MGRHFVLLETNLCIFLVKPVFFLLQKLTHVKSIHKGIIQIHSGIQIDWFLSIGPLSIIDGTKFCFGVSRWNSCKYNQGMQTEVYLQVWLKQSKKQGINHCSSTRSNSFPSRAQSCRWKSCPSKATGLAQPAFCSSSK